MTLNPMISKRALALKPSLTLEISSLAKALKKEGKDICSLSAGEPDFETPSFILEAAMKALKDGFTRYGPAGGDPELKEAIARKMNEINQVPTQSKNVLVTNGGKQAIYNLFQIILNPDDEVIIPSPYWLSYPEIVRLAQARPIAIESSPSDGFKLNLNDLESKINSKTKLIILNSPSNPTGRVTTLEEMKSLANIMRRNQHVSLMSDEIYEFLIDDEDYHYSFASVAPDLIDRIFTVNGFSKAWAMTGWRVGYLVGPESIIKAATAMQSQSTSNVCSFVQRGALAALNGPRECMEKMIRTYNSRREKLTAGLTQINQLTLRAPKGAFYAFPQLNDSKISSISFCKLALEKVGLVMIPGEAFGDQSCFRLSCAVSNEAIEDGMQRLNKLLSN